MNLRYNILWIEDEQDWVNSEIKFIEHYLENFGFILKYKNPKKYEELDFSIYDIIVVDFNLADGEFGQDVIKKIREKEFYTEILFYSNDGDARLREIIATQTKVDGIYCASKDNCGEKLKKLIYTTIRKTQDLNNLRGLIMAETSELDEMMKKILKIIFEKGLVKDEKVIRRKESVKNFYSSNALDLENFNLPNDFLRFLNSKHFSSFGFYSSLCGFSSCDKNTIQKEYITRYKEEIIKMRNKLAHESEFKTLNDDDFIRIRKNIQKYKNIFQEIIDELSS